MGKDQKVSGGMDAINETKNLLQPTFSETVNGGTVCRKAARTGLWGSGEATNRSARNRFLESLVDIQREGNFRTGLVTTCIPDLCHRINGINKMEGLVENLLNTFYRIYAVFYL
ncbi:MULTISPECIES: hypothetical protein [Niastella]|uniref:Uncharacterized protein n=1 Tax=Niastella soli TaxID=2821487 RepID=A0ABS3YVW2_9BACT|nr:hypothetical protein [Niastella soli]MBO9202066.1 hypothetical protein [Niastella soli]